MNSSAPISASLALQQILRIDGPLRAVCVVPIWRDSAPAWGVLSAKLVDDLNGAVLWYRGPSLGTYRSYPEAVREALSCANGRHPLIVDTALAVVGAVSEQLARRILAGPLGPLSEEAQAWRARYWAAVDNAMKMPRASTRSSQIRAAYVAYQYGDWVPETLLRSLKARWARAYLAALQHGV